MSDLSLVRNLAAAALSVLLLAACGDDGDSVPTERATAVTVAWPESRTVERVEVSIGRLEAAAAPVIAAETPGRISRIHRDVGDSVEVGDLLAELDARTQSLAVSAAEAELRRLGAMLENQRVQVARLQSLAERQSISRDQLDQAETQVQVYSAQQEVAQSSLDEAKFNLERTRIVSPVSGRIQSRMVSGGDYVAVGRTLFAVVSPQVLRAILPVPESFQEVLEVGQPVRLAIPSRPGEWIEQGIGEISPVVGVGSRAIELMIDLDNPGGWRPGGSVNAELVLARREGIVVPPSAIVRRPAGTVVFVYDGDERVTQQVVELGVRRPEWVEVLSGLDSSHPVVVDGAGFLSDQARVEVQRWLDPLAEQGQ